MKLENMELLDIREQNNDNGGISIVRSPLVTKSNIELIRAIDPKAPIPEALLVYIKGLMDGLGYSCEEINKDDVKVIKAQSNTIVIYKFEYAGGNYRLVYYNDTNVLVLDKIQPSKFEGCYNIIRTKHFCKFGK